MNDCFKDYLFSKIVLIYIVRNIYNYDMSIEDANKFYIDYNSDDINKNEIKCCFHRFTKEGEYIWSKLNIKDSIIPLSKTRNLFINVKNEEKIEDKNYYEDFFRICLIIIRMIEENFTQTFSKDEINHIEKVKNIKIDYDEDIDEVDDNHIKICYHKFMQMGEVSWALFEFGQDVFAYSNLVRKRKEITEELLKIEENKKFLKRRIYEKR